MRKGLAGPAGALKARLHICQFLSAGQWYIFAFDTGRVGYGLLVDHVDYNRILAVGQFSFRIERFAIKEKKAVWSLSGMGNTYFFETHRKWAGHDRNAGACGPLSTPRAKGALAESQYDCHQDRRPVHL